MELQDLTFRAEGPVALVGFNRPDKLNAMSRRFWPELRAVLDRIANDGSLRTAIFYGEGRCFSVGGDIESFGGLDGAAERRAFSNECLQTLKQLEDLPVPTIAAVHGYALGGGCEATLVCDLVVADETAVFGMPETAVGLFPGLGVIRAHANLSLHAMKEMVFLGERVDAIRAREIGLVNRVVAAGTHLEEAKRMAAIIASRAPLAISAAKLILNRGNADGYAHSTEAIAFLHGTADQAEGVRAFFEKRSPAFVGK